MEGKHCVCGCGSGHRIIVLVCSSPCVQNGALLLWLDRFLLHQWIAVTFIVHLVGSAQAVEQCSIVYGRQALCTYVEVYAAY